jgi:hypothetical protein
MTTDRELDDIKLMGVEPLDPALTLMARTGQQISGCFEIGDADSLADDARKLMHLFSLQFFFDNKVDVSLLGWVAETFQRYLQDEVPSLDAAFNQKRRGRPAKMTPKAKRAIVIAYLAGMRAASAEGIKGRQAEIRGEHEAYKALTGKTVEESKWPGGEGALADSLDRIRAVVKNFFRKK